MNNKIKGNIWKYQVFNAFSFTPVMLPVIVLFWQENALSMYDIYLLQGIFAVAVVLLEVPTGMVADLLGKKQSLLIATFLLTLGELIYAGVSGFWLFFLAEIVLALGISFLSGAGSALLYDSLKHLHREEDFQKYEGWAKAVQLISFALSNLLGGFIGAYSYRLTFIISALGPFIAFCTSLAFIEVQGSGKSSFKENYNSYRTLLSDSFHFVRKHQLVKWLILFYAALFATGKWLLWLYQPYMQFVGFPVWGFGIAFALFNFFAAFASAYTYKIVAYFGRFGSVVFLSFLQIAPLFLMSLFIFPLSFLFILGHQAVRGIARPLINDWLLKYTYKDKRATVLSFLSLGERFFFAVSSPLLGYIGKNYPLNINLMCQGFLLLGIFFILVILYRQIPEKYFVVKKTVTDRL